MLNKYDGHKLNETNNVLTNEETGDGLSTTEKKLIQLWEEILKVDNIDVTDNFFSLGGNSIKAIALEVEIEEVFDVELALKDIYKTLTVNGLAKHIDKLEKGSYSHIPPAEQKNFYPLTALQKSMFNLCLYDNSTSFNMPSVYIIEGNLDTPKFEEVMNTIANRHDAFRTSFVLIEDEPVQKISDRIDFQINYLESDEEVSDAFVCSLIVPFDLSTAPLFRITLVRYKEEKHLLVLDAHHIVSDGTSTKMLMNEIQELYNGNILPKLKINYKDYAVWQSQLLNSDSIKIKERYWKEKLSGELPILNIPFDFPPANNEYEGDAVYTRLQPDVVKAMENIAKNNNTTLFAILFSLYMLLLHKYSGQEDIIVGSIMAGRGHRDIEKLIGLFINVLPIRVQFSSDMNFFGLVRKVSESLVEANDNQEFPLAMIVNNLPNITMEARGQLNPLYNTMFVFHDYMSPDDDIVISDLNFSHYQIRNHNSDLDIKVDVGIGNNGELNCKWEFNSKLFKKNTIHSMARRFIYAAQKIVHQTEEKIKSIDIIPSSEKNKLFYKFNNTAREYPYKRSLSNLFEEQVKKTPDSIAIVFAEKSLTYRELDEQSNRIAWYLRNSGMYTGSIVGVMYHRSLEMVVSIFGILKAGAAYLPIDPEYPEARINYLLNNSDMQVLLTNCGYKERINTKSIKIVHVEDVISDSSLDKQALNIPYDPDSLMYVLYTSGSTGNPKGVMIKNHSFVNLVYWFNSEFEVDDKDNVLLIAPISFDLAQKNLYSPLVKGGRLHLFNPGLYDYVKMADTIRNCGITIINCTPSSFYPLVELNSDTDYVKLESLRYVFLGGEPINQNKLHDWLRSANCNAQIVNTYGPTECTDIVSSFRMSLGLTEDTRTIPIGKPVYNTNIYILDKNLQLVPTGVIGELCVGGVGIAQGYLHDPTLTAEKFRSTNHLPDHIIYRTGDLARWRDDGYIEFMGRIDNQIKIRGRRIELGEIENILRKAGDIDEVVVVPKGAEENKCLCAYIKTNIEMDINQLRENIGRILPVYMVPKYIIYLDKMPISPNGKIDIKALPEPESDNAAYHAPDNELEERLAVIWKSVLHKDKLGVNDDFFLLGGNSLKAIVTISRIHKELNIQLPVSELFKTPTIRGISVTLSKSMKDSFETIKSADNNLIHPVSAAQKRIYLVDRLETDSTNYNIPFAWVIDGSVDKDKIEDLFRRLVQRHESLRTTFELREDQIVQIINAYAEFSIIYKEAGLAEMDSIIGNFVKPFRLEEAPLFRVGLVKVAEQKHILIMDMHHIISDARSIHIIIKEFLKLYYGDRLDPLKIQYKDYVSWQNDFLSSEKQKKQEAFWLGCFAAEIPERELPLDYPRSITPDFAGDKISLSVETELFNALHSAVRSLNATMNMVCFAAYNILVAYYLNREDVVVGMPISGRTHPDLEDVVGMFVNMLAIRSYPCTNKKFEIYLMELKDTLISAFDNQDYPFDMLVEKLNLERSANRNPLFDTSFSYFEYGSGSGEKQKQELSLTSYPINSNTSKFDISMYIYSSNRRMRIDVEYRSQLFKKDTIQKFGQEYLKLLQYIVNDTKLLIGDMVLGIYHCSNFDIGDIEFNFD